MKHLLALTTLLFVGLITAFAQSTEDQYVRIYNLIQQADALNASGKPDLALPKYLEAQTSLQRIHKINPDWQPKVVGFRLRYLEDKIDAVPGAKPATIAAPPSTPTPSPSAPAKSVFVPPAPPMPPMPEAKSSAPSPEVVQHLSALQDDLRRLQAEKTILESKLKEALATQPASIDPRELTKAQETIQTLTKENELLKTTLDDERKKPASVNARELEDSKRALAEAKRKIEEQNLAAMKLEEVRATLQERIGKLSANSESAEALRAENELLKKQLADAKTTKATANSDKAARRLSEAEARIATLTSDAEVLRLEKLALESRLNKAASSTPSAKSRVVSRPADLERIKQLEAQRDDYLARYENATKQAIMGRGREMNTRVEQLTREVANLRTRIDVFEARAIPYSAEELALFTKPVAKPLALAEEKNTRRSGVELSSTTMALASKAQKHFDAKEFDKAEEDYMEILRQDNKNTYSHANLGAIQLELGRLDDAEKHIKAALETSPEDAHATMLLGLLKFRQEKWDDAIEALGRAAKLAPNNAEVHDNLGVALSQKGLRGPAEQAFRRAMILNPNHAGVQSHLALFYALETPPNIPLARFHYQKAIAAGQARNPDVEKLFEKKEAATK